MQDNVEMHIEVYDGKYTFIQYKKDWKVHCLRYNEPWMVFEEGNGAILALMLEYQEKQEQIQKLEREAHDMGTDKTDGGPDGRSVSEENACGSGTPEGE